MSGPSDLALRLARATGLHRVAKPIARALVPRWLSLLPANFINDTYFSGFCCLDGLAGGRFLMHRDPTSVDLATNGLASFGGEGLRCLSALLPTTRVFLDIGANTGVYSLMAARNGVAVVHAFEPVPMIHARLQANAAANRFGTVSTHQIALTDRDGSITLYVPSGEMPTEASTREGFRPGSKAIDVRAQTVDGFVAEHGVGRVDLMKIDTESTEPSVLEGALRTVARDRPTLLVEVLHGLTEERLHALLDPLDYRYFWITDTAAVPVERIAGDADYRFLNFVFVPAEKANGFVEAMGAVFTKIAAGRSEAGASVRP